MKKNLMIVSILLLAIQGYATETIQIEITQVERAIPDYPVIQEARAQAEARAKLKYTAQEREIITQGADHRSSHRGSYHTYAKLYEFGARVELEDGSIWFVFPSERHKVLDFWIPGHAIAILKGDPNSNYRYRLRNEVTKDIIEVEFSDPPYVDSRFTIYDINKEQRYLLLSDGSKWSLPANWFEQEVWMKWYIGDTIVIGSNDQFLYSLIRPDILINVTCSASFTPSKCLN